ncbi:MAG: urea ABC transporter permease subunit UrtB [Proteobacteria bacterium]|nr:urea ABC transporter permease subunit UrtB [Pseudomonadota bacterium]
MKNLNRLILLIVLLFAPGFSFGENSLEEILTNDFGLISKSSAKTVRPVIEKLEMLNSSAAIEFLDKWQTKNLWFLKQKQEFVYVEKEGDRYRLTSPITGKIEGAVEKNLLKQVKPNSGVRAIIGSALVGHKLMSDDLEKRQESVEIIGRELKRRYLIPVAAALKNEKNVELKQKLERLNRFLIIKFDPITSSRADAIRKLSGDLSVEARAVLNPLITSSVFISEKALNELEINIARKIIPGVTGVASDGTAKDGGFMGRGVELTIDQAYQLLVKRGLVPPDISEEQKRNAIVENIIDGRVGGFRIEELGSADKRNKAYLTLTTEGLAPHSISGDTKREAVEKHFFYGIYDDDSKEVVSAAKETLAKINRKVGFLEFVDLFLDGVSLASIFFLAAIGLAITFGVMGVINMAHGEFIMIGAYTGYVVQLFVTDYTLSLILAFPLAFLVTFTAGVLMERLLIRKLYHRPLETLLATFGISIALQQVFKNIFGTQARPLTSPEWLDGAVVFNEIVSISSIRIAIFILGIVFFGLLLFVLNRTRLGLETRAVTQNPKMASAMGVNVDRINMFTFGLGSGIAGIAGVAIGLYAKVTSELGTDYIVQSFMTVVVGGVGNIWGTLAGAALIGFLQKGIEWMNPSNTLAAQTYMIIFIIIFIQFRPRGIISLKGRAVGD